MELDAAHDHAQAVAQMEGKAGLPPRRRKSIKKPPANTDSVMEENTKNEQGKREAPASSDDLPPKCLQLPKTDDVSEADAAKALAANATAEAQAAAAKAKKELDAAAAKKA